MQPVLLAMAVSALCQKITLEEFQYRSGIACKTAAKCVLEYLVNNGIGKNLQNGYSFSRVDRLKVAILALQSGNDIGVISKSLSWQDFEEFASTLLNLSGYVAECNVRFSKPNRIQIDVVGVNYNSQLAIVVDCKHWRRNNFSSITYYARKQAHRTSLLLLHRRNKICQAVPMILTLYPVDMKLVDGIPIVPIIKFNSFIENVALYLSKIKVIYA
ncbi:MAG TPA: restriction endonuclease [Nitrososphaeraceae archaeon]|nr:restriction endonuclease [Nitrososphaeraceae archaeon]